MSKQAEHVYQSFLVRCWLLSPSTCAGSLVWRFELRDVSPESQKQYFSDLEQLKAYMSVRLSAIAVGSGHADDKEAGQIGGGS